MSRAILAAVSLAIVASCGTGRPAIPAGGTPASASPTPSVSAHATATPTNSSPVALPAWLAGPVVTRLPTSQRVVALTFDGGAGAQGAAAVLQTLQNARVPATFFLTGQFAAANPDLVVSIADNGYLIGNHTTTHPHLNALSSGAVIAEITTAQNRLEGLTGDNPQPLLRFPFGEYDGRTLQLVHALGYGAIGWTVDTRGWQGRAAGTAADVVSRVKAALQPGAIVLMHLGANPSDGSTLDADALPAVIATVGAAGFHFVALAAYL